MLPLRHLYFARMAGALISSLETTDTTIMWLYTSKTSWLNKMLSWETAKSVSTHNPSKIDGNV